MSGAGLAIDPDYTSNGCTRGLVIRRFWSVHLQSAICRHSQSVLCRRYEIDNVLFGRLFLVTLLAIIIDKDGHEQCIISAFINPGMVCAALDYRIKWAHVDFLLVEDHGNLS